MHSLAALLLWYPILAGPNGHLIHNQLQAPAVVERLPLAAIGPALGELWVVFHHQDEWPRAFYARSGLSAAGLQPAAGEQLLDPRLFVDQARLLLYGPSYRRPDGGLVALESMPVDVADIYLASLFQAYLDSLDPADSVYAAHLHERAAELVDVPAAQRLGALHGALADFGAHAVKVAVQVLRVTARKPEPGALCPVLRQELALFKLWRGAFESGGYPLQYLASEEGESRWRSSTAQLAEDDKARFVEAVLGGRWSGDPQADFAWLCPPS